MRIANLLMVTATLMIAGCATAPRTNHLSIGMTRQDVVGVMGRPSNTAANSSGIMVLRYRLSATGHDAFHHRTEEYFVRLIDGKVDCYGRSGDFDSKKDSGLTNVKNK